MSVKQQQATHAVVLSDIGLGCNSAYGVGVCHALIKDKGIRPRIYSGTVFGAYSAGILAGGPEGKEEETADHLLHIWRDRIGRKVDPVTEAAGLMGVPTPNGLFRMRFDPREYLSGSGARNPMKAFSDAMNDAMFMGKKLMEAPRKFAESDGPMTARMANQIHVPDLIDISPWRDLVKDTIDIEAVRNSKRRLRIVITDWKEGVAFARSNERVTHADFEAAGALISIFPYTEIKGRRFTASGGVNPVPLIPAIEEAVSLHPKELVVHVAPPSPNLHDPINQKPRSTMVEYEYMLLMQMIRLTGHIPPMPFPITIHYYYPHIKLWNMMTTMDFSHTSITRYINEGQERVNTFEPNGNATVHIPARTQESHKEQSEV